MINKLKGSDYVSPLSVVKCDEGHLATLDSMVKKDVGVYRCVDCETEDYVGFDLFDNDDRMTNIRFNRLSILGKAIRWCLG